MVRRVFSYAGKFIVRPKKAAEDIAQDEAGLWAGFWWAIIFTFAYSITALVFHLLGHQPVSTPFLPIPLERWYLVQTFTTIPVGLAALLSYAGVAYITCKAWGGRGDFDTTFASQSYTTQVPWVFFTWIPEMFVFPIFIAQGAQDIILPEWLENIRQFVLPISWLLIISTIALSEIHKIKWWKSLIAVLVSLIPMVGIMAVFIR